MKRGLPGSEKATTLKAMTFFAVAFVCAVVAAGGCSSSSTPSIAASPTPAPSVSPTPTRSGTPTPTPAPTPTAVNFVVMAYTSVAPTVDPTYGEINGYGQVAAAPTTTPLPTVTSQVVTVHCNQTIQFYNLDRIATHTASLLGPASGANWPLFNNVNAPSFTTPQDSMGLLTPITYPSFSTTLGTFGSSLSTSLVYSTGTSAGAFYFEDYYEYSLSATPPMRTVINILCP